MGGSKGVTHRLGRLLSSTKAVGEDIVWIWIYTCYTDIYIYMVE
jgi:hypothetical protein